MTKSTENLVMTPATVLKNGMILVNQDGYEFKITGMDSRMAIVSTDTGRHVESIIHAAIRIKYKYYREA